MSDEGVRAEGTLGIGELARRTGLTQQVIRAWESRFDFPIPARTDGGRRLYSPDDVDRLQRVVALKESGVRLAQAVARIRGEESVAAPSIYAAIRDRHPQIESRVLRRDVLVPISHAIEDEAMSRASRPLVFGCFQRETFYRQAAPRWEEIARTAGACLVFADFSTIASGAGRPVEVPLEPESPLLREWAVVVTGHSFSVVLTAWEVPRQTNVPLHEREFESMFTFDPAAVRTAAEVCVAAARSSRVVPARLLRTLGEHLATEPTPAHGVDALVLRAFDYLQRR